nr:MAG TPA: Erv1 / Alr family protein [Caudoviricetes sp.]
MLVSRCRFISETIFTQSSFTVSFSFLWICKCNIAFADYDYSIADFKCQYCKRHFLKYCKSHLIGYNQL